MTEYIYKGFKVHYELSPSEQEPSSYNAKGWVVSNTNLRGPTLTQKFQTEGPSKSYVQQEIKKEINEYIDFEWNQFINMQGTV